MVFLKESKRGVHSYFELVESVREGNSVRQRVLKRFRGLREANEYAEKNGIATIGRA